jgi:hypothetical protein
MPSNQVPRYLYFDVDDTFTTAPLGPLDITIEYLDDRQIRFGLEYDSFDVTAAVRGAYKAHPRTIQGHGSGRWRAAVFRVTDARFGGSQNGMADFRLVLGDGPLAVRSVTVRRVNGR